MAVPADDESEAGAIGIVAGGGDLVKEIIHELNSSGEEIAVAAIDGEADASLNGDNVGHFNWGEIGRILRFFKDRNCRRLVLAGRITARPDFRSIIGDPGTLLRLPKIIAAVAGGDDALLKRVIGLIEAEGFRVIGASEVAPNLLAREGHLGGVKRDPSLSDDIAFAKTVLRDLGRHDIGQAVVVEKGRIVAVEAAEGTDGMLQRVAALREAGRLSKKRGGILVKATKPEQDQRVDLPVIGPDTVKNATEAGLTGIVVEADRVLVVSRGAMIDSANRADVFVVAEDGFQS
ncbi:MAG: UDP-2,3-diacylglucosamine diphosphatase LpxI [Pseudomonadota bacterium]